MSYSLLLAVADPEVASRASALAQESEELEVMDAVSELDELERGLQRWDVDVVVLSDVDLARQVATRFPLVGLVLIASDDSPALLKSAMQAGLRDVVTLPLALEQLEASVRNAALWSRALRDQVAGEEVASGALAGTMIAVAGAKGGVGTTTIVLQLAMAAVRAVPGRPVCVVDFDLLKGDFRSLLELPQRRSVADLVDVAQEISLRHLQETLYLHREGFRVLLAPEEPERAEEIDSQVARAVLTAVRSRHALTIVDLGSTVTEAAAIGAEMAARLAIVATPDVAALRGVRRLRELWRRLEVREGEDLQVVLNRTSRKLEIQPDLARKVAGVPVAKATIPADFAALEAAVNTGAPGRLEDAKLRAAYDALAAELGAVEARPEPGGEDEVDNGAPRGLLSRLSGERGQSSAEVMGLLPVLVLVVLGLWQLGLTGYTYVLAGHSAREGARELAVDTSDPPNKPPAYRVAARDDLPKAWRDDARIDRDEVTVKVSLKVPIVFPGLGSPVRVGSSADTSIEDEPLPDYQRKDPL